MIIYFLKAGGAQCVPYISGSVSLQGSGTVTGNGVHVSELALQKVAVRVGLAQHDDDSASLSKQHDAGIICAVRGAEVRSTVHYRAIPLCMALACSA